MYIHSEIFQTIPPTIFTLLHIVTKLEQSHIWLPTNGLVESKAGIIKVIIMTMRS